MVVSTRRSLRERLRFLVRIELSPEPLSGALQTDFAMEGYLAEEALWAVVWQRD
jgi:hypothetical protein